MASHPLVPWLVFWHFSMPGTLLRKGVSLSLPRFKAYGQKKVPDQGDGVVWAEELWSWDPIPGPTPHPPIWVTGSTSLHSQVFYSSRLRGSNQLPRQLFFFPKSPGLL